MSRRLFVPIIVLTLALYVNADGIFSFPWESGLLDIKSSESQNPLLEDSDLLVYETFIVSEKVQKIYSFKEDRLASVFYIFTETPEGLKDYLTDYEKIDFELETLFGIPISSKKHWLDKRFDSFPELALALGDLYLNSIWIVGPDTLLTHSLYAEDLNITHAIFLNALDDILGEASVPKEPGDNAEKTDTFSIYSDDSIPREAKDVTNLSDI